MAKTMVVKDITPENEGNNWCKRAAASHMQFWKWAPLSQGEEATSPQGGQKL